MDEISSRKNGYDNGGEDVSFLPRKSLACVNGLVTTSFINMMASMTVHQMAQKGKIDLLEQFLERISNRTTRKKRLNAKDDKELTALHYAARYHDYKMMECLIKNGANVTAFGEDDLTPLHFLAKYNHRKAVEHQTKHSTRVRKTLGDSCVQLLVSNGAKVNAKDSLGLTPLHHGCARGNSHTVKDLLSFNSIDLELRDQQGMTALHFACLYGHLDIVRMLTDKDCQLMPKDKDATTPLHLACVQGSLDIVKLFFEKAKLLSKFGTSSARAGIGVQLSIQVLFSQLGKKPQDEKKMGAEAILLYERDDHQCLPIHVAIENGHTEVARYFIKVSTDKGLRGLVNEKQLDGLACLHLAVRANNFEIVKTVLSEGADINCQDNLQVTPLFLACQLNLLEIAKYLLEKDANFELKDSMSMTPLLVASRNGHVDIVKILLLYNADITETDKDEKTCLMWAAEENRTEIIQIIMAKDERKMLQERDKYNNTPLHLAAAKGNEESIKMLKGLGAVLDLKNSSERTALHMSASAGHSTIISDLTGKEHSIINATDEEGNSALHLAAIDGNSQCVQELINIGVNIEIRNTREWTALDCAAANGREKVAKMLLECGANIESSGKIKVSALHLACKRGHPELVKLLLLWKADVTFKSVNGKNALDFALDFSHKECVLPIIKQDNWQLSMKNAIPDSITGMIDTPMRKLIRKMPDMAEMILNRCVIDNGKRMVDEDFAVTFMYEYLDDTYACTEWLTGSTEMNKTQPLHANDGDTVVGVEDATYKVYEENDRLTESAFPYDTSPNVLKENHPLKIMISSKCRQLLVHPVVTSLLNNKWNRFGRYIYYFNLAVFAIFLIFLNMYALMLPRFYTINWTKLMEERKAYAYQVPNVAPRYKRECLFLRGVIYGSIDCYKINRIVFDLRHIIFFFAVVKLAFEGTGIMLNVGRVKMATITLMILYVLSILITINFHEYTLSEGLKTIPQVNRTHVDVFTLRNLQEDTGLRQEWQEKMSAFAVFLSWINLLMMLQKVPLVPSLGIFVIMFTNTLETFAQFFLILIFFIVGFALSFFILAGNQDVFSNWYESIITIFVMMVGEIDYSDRFYQSKSFSDMMFTRDASYVLFIIFVIVMTIIIMNLLVGLAVGDIMQVREDATLQRLGLQIHSTLDIEFFLPQGIRKKFSLRKETIENKKKKKSVFGFTPKSSVPEALKNFNRPPEDDDSDEDQVDNISEIDRVLSTLTSLRSRVEDMIDEQGNMSLKVRKLGIRINEVQEEARSNTSDLKSNLSNTGLELSERITHTHVDLKGTRQEVAGARDIVNFTKDLVIFLKEEFIRQETQMNQIHFDLTRNISMTKEELIERIQKVEEAEQNLKESVSQTRSTLIQRIDLLGTIETNLTNQINDIKDDISKREHLLTSIRESQRESNVKLSGDNDEIKHTLTQLKLAFASRELSTDV